MNMLKGDRNDWETYGGGIAFYKPGVKAIWLMFAVLKELLQELSIFIYGIPAVTKKKSKKCIEYSRKCCISITYLKLYLKGLFKM